SSAAFKDFQEKNDLPDDGILQAATWTKLLAPGTDLSLELETELASSLDDLDLDLGLETEAEPDLVLGLEPLEPDLDLDLGLAPVTEPDSATDPNITDPNTDLANTIAELPDSGVKLIKTYEFGDTPPEDGADELLLEKIAKVLPPQKKIPAWSTFNDSQRGAIVSFAYDVGTDFYGAAGFEALTRVLKEGQWDQLEATLVTHHATDSSAEAGLKRRLSEAELFLKEVPGESLSPPGQQFLSGVLASTQQYFDAQGEKFEAGQRIVSVTRPLMRGDDIATAQKALVKQGYDIDTDGIFGPASKAALEAFQQENGLAANGILDATTWENLLVAEPVSSEPVSPEPVSPEPGSQPDLDTLPVIPIGEPTLGEPGVTPESPPADLPPAKWICTLQRDTVLKLRPDDADQLSDVEKQTGTAGATYGLQSYAYADPVLGDFNGHLKVALQNETINGFNTWFVKGDAVQITSAEGDVVYPWEEQQATFVLKVFRDTVFKRLPMQSGELTEAEKVEVSKDTELELHSYAYQDTHGDFSNHIRVALKRQEDYLNGLSQWYVYDKHAYVEYDSGIVYPPAPLLKVTQDTIIKRRPVQSSELPNDQKYIIPDGRAFILDSWAHTDEQGRSFNRHIKFTIKLETEFIEKISTWYVYDQHAQVIWNDKVLYPPFRGNPFKLPGNETTFYTGQPIIEEGDFTWGEATKNGTRLPANAEIVNNIIDLAQELQKARNLVGKPFVINSWYRTPEANSAVGGARNSLHLQGRAVDMYVPGYSVRQVANALMSSWPGGILIYSTHLHLDTGRKQVIFL
ncbi:MAG: peptidoglycan-binding protein, partial [Cyanobacteria bacterium P01_F01_bin.4]